jgi:uncharacterized protein (TIGR03435 family)
MQIIADPIRRYRKVVLSTAGIVAVVIASACGLLGSAPTQTPPQAQNTTAAAPSQPDFKFEVASIKPTKNPNGGWRLNDTDDGISGLNVPLVYLVHQAFGIYEDYRYPQTPVWLTTDHYDVEAKMDGSVAEQFRKLPRAERIVAKQHMLQVLLEERFNLKVHRETKEFPVYFLVVAKNGTKLQESKPKPDDPSAENGVWGGGGTKEGVRTITAHLVPIQQLASQLTGIVGRTVQDKTGLTGRYDLTLKYAPDQSALSPTGGASEGPPVPSASDPGGVSIFTAVQDQLGLKLEAGKGPMEIIVIDHIEKPSGN